MLGARSFVASAFVPFALALASGGAGCSSGDDSATATGDAGGGSDAIASGDGTTNGGDAASAADASLVEKRPYNFHVPTSYDASKPTPLVIMLHGYSASGALEESYFQLTATSDANDFLYAYPDGTPDASGKLFWNADDACCNFGNLPVDDVAYVSAIIDDVESKYNVDAKRVFVIGHSNGAFMSHRLACDLSDRIAAIVALAGAVWNDPSKCNPTSKVSVLDVHGDADTTILYGGGAVATGEPPYPSEAQTMSTWAGKNGCTGALTDNGQTLDLDTGIAGSETSESSTTSCPTGIDVELWTIHGGGHIPALAHPTWGDSVWAFMKAHPKP